MKKPTNLVYGLEEWPPIAVSLFNGIQLTALIAINIIYPVIIFRLASTPTESMENLLAIGMIVLAVTTFIQIRRLGPIGSGYMCPSTFTATFLGPSTMAVSAGGLPLVFGMTAFAGAFEAAVAPLLNRLRPIFPSEISGLVIFMIGVSSGSIALRNVFGPTARPMAVEEWIVGAITLASVIALNVWGKNVWRMLCALIGLVIGYLAAFAFGLFNESEVQFVRGLAWVGVPKFEMPSLSFDWELALPFAIAAMAAAMKAAGTITVCERVNDADWLRPDMKMITRGVLADGAGNLLAGLLGSVGINTSTPAVGVASVTGVVSRSVGYAVSVAFLAAAFLPKLPALFSLMPRAIVLAALLFAVTSIIMNGLQVMMSRLLDARRTLVLGLSIIAGIAVEIFPGISASMPHPLTAIAGSSLVFATVIALFLNAIFRFGIRRRTRLLIARNKVDAKAIEAFLTRQCQAWGAPLDVASRAVFGALQLVDAAAEMGWSQGGMTLTASFDEFNLDLEAAYPGEPLAFPEKRPSMEEVRDNPDGVRLLAGFMLRRNADQIVTNTRDGLAVVKFRFNG